MTDSQLTPDGQPDAHAYIMQQIARNERAAARAHKAEDEAKRAQLENARWEDGRIHKAH